MWQTDRSHNLLTTLFPAVAQGDDHQPLLSPSFDPLPPTTDPCACSAVHLGATGAALHSLKWKKSGSPQLRFADAGRRGPALLSQFAGASIRHACIHAAVALSPLISFRRGAVARVQFLFLVGPLSELTLPLFSSSFSFSCCSRRCSGPPRPGHGRWLLRRRQGRLRARVLPHPPGARAGRLCGADAPRTPAAAGAGAGAGTRVARAARTGAGTRACGGAEPTARAAVCSCPSRFCLRPRLRKLAQGLAASGHRPAGRPAGGAGAGAGDPAFHAACWWFSRCQP